MKHCTAILALTAVTVLANPAPHSEGRTSCGICDFGGVSQQLSANSPTCTTLNKLGGSSIGKCVNLYCRICMFFKDSKCENMDLTWAGLGSPYFAATKFHSYSCAT